MGERQPMPFTAVRTAQGALPGGGSGRRADLRGAWFSYLDFRRSQPTPRTMPPALLAIASTQAGEYVTSAGASRVWT
jgi:hypothetical protein